MGQAFYIILTGSVEVWVASPESDKRDREGADANKGLITEGLGNKVTNKQTNERTNLSALAPPLSL